MAFVSAPPPTPTSAKQVKSSATRLGLFEVSWPGGSVLLCLFALAAAGGNLIHVALPLISCNMAFISAVAIASIFSRRLPHLASAFLSRRMPPPCSRALFTRSLARRSSVISPPSMLPPAPASSPRPFSAALLEGSWNVFLLIVL